MNQEHEGLVAQTFVQLADSRVADFDIIDLLMILTDRCVELLDVQAAGILLSDDQGKRRVMAASSDAVRLLELFQLPNEEGPCLEAFSSGEPVIHAELAAAAERWPSFAPEATGAGFGSVYAMPPAAADGRHRCTQPVQDRGGGDARCRRRAGAGPGTHRHPADPCANPRSGRR